MHFGGLEDDRKDYTEPHITFISQQGSHRQCGLAICAFHLGFSLALGESAKARGLRLKVNTVVNRYNLDEDFRSFIRAMGPERWKVFQALSVEGQNDRHFGEFAVSRAEFDLYVERNRSVEQDGITVVPENNEMMTGSYLMIDPLGRFFDDTQGKHTYSRPILEVGVPQALEEIMIYPERFAQRGGLYL